MKPKTMVATVKPVETGSRVLSLRLCVLWAFSQYNMCRQTTSINTQVEVGVQLRRDVQSVLDDRAVDGQLILLIGPDCVKMLPRYMKRMKGNTDDECTADSSHFSGFQTYQ